MAPDDPASPGASGTTSSSGATDVLLNLLRWCGSIVTDIAGLLADEEAGPIVLAELGFSGAVPNADAFDQTVHALQSINTSAAADSTSTGTSSSDSTTVAMIEEFGQITLAAAMLIDAIAGTADRGGDPWREAARIVADLIDLTVTARMRQEHPAIWAVLRALSIITDDAVSIANIGNLLTDARTYLSGLVDNTGGFEQEWQDYSTLVLAPVAAVFALIPTFGWLDRYPGLHVFSSFGWNPPPGDSHPHISTLLQRAATIELDVTQAPSEDDPAAADLPTTGETVTLTFLLVPEEHNSGSWGLYLRIGGSLQVSVPIGRYPAPPPDPSATPPATTPALPPASGWQLNASVASMLAPEFLFASNPQAGVDMTGLDASIAFERPESVDGSWLIGARDATHVEIQHARLGLTLHDDESGMTFGAGASCDHLTLVIKLGGDNFLSSVLPRELRLDSAIDLGVDTRRGFYMNGGVTLRVDLPMNLVLGSASVLALVVQGLHLRIGFVQSAADGTTGGGTASGTSTFKLSAGLTVDLQVTIAGGKVTASVAGIGGSFALQQGQPSADHTVAWTPSGAFVPPNGLGIAINAGPVAGGGFIGFNPDAGEYTGALQLHLALTALNVDIAAIGMLNTTIPGAPNDWAFLIILSASFSPGIQLGMGIALSGVGGMLGINHSIDADAIAAGLRTHSLDGLLFPADPVGQAPQIFSTLRHVMPLNVGHFVVGPMIELSWGGPTKPVTVQVAILFEFTEHALLQIVLLGRVLLAVPNPTSPLVHIRIDIAGRLKFDPLDLLIQAALVDSTIAGFTVTGGAVIVARGGTNGTFVLSIGGFHPHFTPPSNVPVVDRLCIDISGSTNPRVRLEAYLAVTSQTFQFGARAEVHFAVGPVAVDGWLQLDVLIAWLPHFRFSAEIAAGMSLSYNSAPLLELTIDVLLEGPGPWHLSGSASFGFLFLSVTVPIDATWGQVEGPTASIVQPIEAVRSALNAADAWSGSLPPGVSGLVTLRPPAGSVIAAHPLGTVSCRQRAVPLGMQVTHVGNQPLAAPTTVDVTALVIGSVTDPRRRRSGSGTAGSDRGLCRRAVPRSERRPGALTAVVRTDAGRCRRAGRTGQLRHRHLRRDHLQDDRALGDHEDEAAAVAAPGGARRSSAQRPYLDTAARRPGSVRGRVDTLRHGAGTALKTASLASESAGGARLLDLVGIVGRVS